MQKEINWLLKEKYDNQLTRKAEGDIERLKKGEPVDYLIGFVNFLGCKIDLSKKPLIPRPETEYWVGEVIKELKKNKEINILDIFSGSGCIGVAILKNVKKAKVDFVEKNKKLLEQIAINLKLNNIGKDRYKIIQSDIFDKVRAKYDYIFANPPYIAKTRKGKIQKSVLKYEPKEAFFAGKDGFLYIKRFLRLAPKFLNNGGRIYMEFDSFQKKDIIRLMEDFQYNNWKIYNDQFSKPRYLVIES